jgi:hypothetical protein
MLSPKMLLVALTDELLLPRTSSMATSNQKQRTQPNKEKSPRNKSGSSPRLNLEFLGSVCLLGWGRIYV